MTTALKTPEIAIIGMAGRFPKSRNVDEFWLNLKEGRECISTFTDEELIEMGVSPQILDDPSYVKAGYEVEGMELFDASFFGYTPREAELMDPQQRLFLECAWEALENAGLDAVTEEGLIGIYAGAGLSRYLYNLYSNMNVAKSVNMVHVGLANDLGNLAMRVAYKLNLKGPSIALRTACSTSLVAVHLASQALINEECDVALAGGVYLNLQHQPKVGYLYEEGSIFSPDGHCRAFDAKAQGTVFGSGLGVVVLKRLDRALADGDCIRAVIKGSAINNDGALKVGYTAPSLEGQAEVIIESIANAGVDPETISYVEAHATGTSMGDPIEMAAITRAYRSITDKKNFCAIGSVKTNVGHLEAAAGVTALIKTVLALQHEMIPPSLHFEEPNPSIDFANSPFYVNSELREWKSNGHPRRAGVSSFGIGGTNVHLIVEEAPFQSASGPSRPSQLLLLSARSAAALDQATANLAAHLREHAEVTLADVAYTLATGRRNFAHRRMIVCESVADAVQVLEAGSGERVFTTPADGAHERPLVFMFSGQGSQQINMGAGLYQSEPRFRQEVDRCAELLRPILGLDLREVLYPRQGEEQAAEQQLVQTWLTQPALFVVEYALAQLWMSWGVSPAAMIGHSVGEYVAACVAGVMTLDEALRLVAGRGRLMQSVPPGAMLSVSLPEQELRASVNGQISLAAVNHPDTCVVAGETDAINNLVQVLEHKGVSCRQLPVSHAFHSRMMHAVREPFRELVESVRLNTPQVPFISSVTGKWITAEQATSADYWVSQMCEPVRFAGGVAELWRDSERVLLEVGPGHVLSNLARRHPACPNNQLVLSSLSRNNAQASEQGQALSTLGRMWAQGVAVKWPVFYSHERRQTLPLPTYPFERKKYWLDIVDQQQVQVAGKTIAHPLIDRLVAETVDQEIYATDFNAARHWVLTEHRITGQCVLPGTAYLEIARAAASLYLGQNATCLRDVVFQTPLLVKENETRQVQTVIRERDGEIEFRVISANDRDSGQRTDRWTTHARGIISQESVERSHYNIADLENVCNSIVELNGNEGPHKTLEVGPRWQSLKQVRAGEGEAIAYLELPEEFQKDAKQYRLHPALLDIATSFYHAGGERNHLYMPLGYDELRVYGSIPARCYAYTKQRVETNGEIRKKDVVVMDVDGNTVADIKGFSLKKISNIKAKFRELESGNQHYYEIKWRPASIEPVKESRAEGVLLVFADEHGLGTQVADLFRQQGRRVIEVEFGDEYEQVSQDRYRIRTGEEDHERLIAEVADQQISQVLHLASVSRKEVAGAGALEHSLDRGVYSLFHLTRALLKNKTARDVSFVVVANNTDEVTGLEETINPAGACLFGVGRVLDHEQEGIRCRGLDIDESTTAEHIKAEIENDAESHHVAYRNGERFVGELKAAKLTSFPEIETAIESDGVYVITGGTGGIGLEISRYFASKNNEVKLAWINRTPMPARDQWDDLLRDSGDEKLRRRIEAIREIEAGGGEVSFYTGDVSRLEDVEAILSDLRTRYGRIRGVVHSAGIAGQGVIFKKELSAFRQTMSPKVAGTWNLDHATAADELDFFVMCSSSAVLWGLPGQSDYTAANMYQDSFASSRAKRGKRTISINWPTWDETGMAVDHGVQKDSGFFKSISTNAGIERFDEILNTGIRRVIVGEINHGLGMRARGEGSLADLNFQFPIVIADGILNSFRSSEQGSHSQSLPDVVLKGREEHEYTTTERELASVWAKEMGLTEVDVFSNFYDVGGDSLIAIRIANTIKKYLGKHPHISDLLEYPTIAELATHLDGSVDAAAPAEIQHRTTNGRFELSTTQMGIWYLQKLNPQTTVYHVPASRVLNEKVDFEKLQAVVNTLVRRHSALRTIFEEHDGAVEQVVLENAEVEIDFSDFSGTTGNRELVENLIKTDSERPFDFSKPLFRAAVYKLAEDQFYVSLNLHHIIADGWSVAMFWNELQTLYAASLKGEEVELAPIEVEYADFVADQKQWLNSSDCVRMENYWLQELAKPLPQLNLPTVARGNSSISSYDSITIKLTAAERKKVRSLAQQLDVTLHTLLLSTYCVALRKMTGDSELIVGVPFSARDRQELERVMGVFVNLISIRIDLNATGDFKHLVAKIREKSLEAYKNGKYPFDMLVEKLNPERRSGRNPIFSTMFQFEFMPSANQIPLIDISVCGQEVDNEIEIRINYDATRMVRDSIDTLASYFMSALRTIIETPDLSLAELDHVVGEYEKTQRLRKVESQGRLNLQNLRSARREPIRVSTYGD